MLLRMVLFLFMIHFEWIAVCWFNSIPVIVVTLGLIRAWHHLSNFEHNHGDTQAHADRESEFQGVRWSWTWSWTHYNMSVFLAVTPPPTFRVKLDLDLRGRSDIWHPHQQQTTLWVRVVLSGWLVCEVLSAIGHAARFEYFWTEDFSYSKQ